MNAGGISARLFEFARALVGPLRGGLAHVNVVTSMFFGGMIGSSTADLAGTGSIVIPAMKKHGYPADFAAALSASSAGIGPMIPPSSPMILYSAVTGTSLGALFLAGLIPGILLGVSQMAIVAWLARRFGWQPYGRFSWREIGQAGRRAALSFGLPVIIVGGLVIGVFTPTEASAFAAAYAIFLACWVYRVLRLGDLYRVFVNAVQLTGELLLIVSLSFALGWGLANAHVPEALARGIDALVIGDSQFLRILSMVILAIIAGMVLDPLIPVLLPIILPTLLAYHIDLIHFGVLMVIAVIIGQVTPPMAIALVITGRHRRRRSAARVPRQSAVPLGHARVPAADHGRARDRHLAAEHRARLIAGRRQWSWSTGKRGMVTSRWMSTLSIRPKPISTVIIAVPP